MWRTTLKNLTINLHKTCLIVILYGIIGSIFSLSAKEREIEWLLVDRPPWFITEGDRKGTGYGDIILGFWKEILHDYKHHTRVVNLMRLAEEIKTKQACVPTLVKHPFYAKYRAWSKPVYLLTPYRIIVRPVTKKKLGNQTTFSIINLVKNKQYIYGQNTASSVFIPEMNPYLNQSNVEVVSSSSTFLSLLKMLKAGRVDWILDYPSVLKAMMLVHNVSFEVDSMSVIEFENRQMIGYVNCLDSEEGKRIIQRLNERIDKALILKIRKELFDWQPDQATISELTRLNKDFFGF